MDSSDSVDGSPDEPKTPNRGRSKKTKKETESLLKQKSPAEFFAENKNIAGFDNPGKSLYTTVRELVENALDSAESISQLPDIELVIEEITKSKFNTMIGLVNRERVDEELYDDFESAKAREKRLAKEARMQEVQAKNLTIKKKLKELPVTKSGKGRGESSFFKVTFLSGTKYGLKQTRGKFGLGAKMFWNPNIGLIRGGVCLEGMPKMSDRVNVLEERVTMQEVCRKLEEHRSDQLEEYRMSIKQVELPMFDGWDPMAWITRAEIYFEVHNTSNEVKVKLAYVSMEGYTFHWFNLLNETEVNLTWEKLKPALIARYGRRRHENPFEELATLKQIGNVEEFIEAFELISSQVPRLPEEQYIDYFMSGLQPHVRRRVRTLSPLSRGQLMRMTKDVEEELLEKVGISQKPIGKKLWSNFVHGSAVLGVPWLKTLGKVVMDWKEMTMQFHHEDLLVILQAEGVPSQTTLPPESELNASQQLKLSRNCSFQRRKLGHIISGQGVSVDPSKIQSKPLTKLAKRDNFHWGSTSLVFHGTQKTLD
ncbi:hypothetical protein ZIOFF_034568 [Zingiber officinale]|uniref:Retrotransposon gag domain-containing protein n=1 Tax=Zingiber officinale TaxID=94328 RepID=A0A8J5GPU3_ZINOF|nr:hypothetical protein ZIOFF_034568 [Zingiber officinale]